MSERESFVYKSSKDRLIVVCPLKSKEVERAPIVITFFAEGVYESRSGTIYRAFWKFDENGTFRWSSSGEIWQLWHNSTISSVNEVPEIVSSWLVEMQLFGVDSE